MFKKIFLFGGMAVLLLALMVLFVLIRQGKREPDTSGQYVALGSSFAAGLNLGKSEVGSPFVCMRSTNGYPHHIARLTGLTLVDMSCSGSTTEHILHGGQVFLGPQLAAIGPATQLVTITTGGNDVGYIGDLTFAAGSAGVLGKQFWKGAKPLNERPFEQVGANLRSITQTIHARAPKALVVLISYPPVLPDTGTCSDLSLDPAMADLGRAVGTKLYEVTKNAAEQAGVLFVDMTRTGAGHDVCSQAPWVNGSAPSIGAPFHPNLAGAKATAEAVMQALSGKLPARSGR